MAKWREEGKRLVILYCGDHDPGGLNISGTLRENLRDMEPAADTPGLVDEIKIDRFGLNYDFIMGNGLSWVGNLQTSSGGDLSDPRHGDHDKPYVQSYLRAYGARKVEANALVTRVDAGRELCRQALSKHLTEDGLRRFENSTRSIREHVQREIIEALARRTERNNRDIIEALARRTD